MIRRPPRSTLSSSSAASDVYKRQLQLPSYTGRRVAQQKALLEIFRLLVVEWGPKVDYILGGGDFNASLSQRSGYSQTTATKQADRSLQLWFELLKSAPIVPEPTGLRHTETRARLWEVHEPNVPTWNSVSNKQRSVLDRFLTLGIGQATCKTRGSPHVVHDHSVIWLTINSSIISTLPPHEDLIKPARLKMENWEKENCLLYTSPSPRDRQKSRMPSSA